MGSSNESDNQSKKNSKEDNVKEESHKAESKNKFFMSSYDYYYLYSC